MKKSLIALAVAGALATPMIAQADSTIYGSMRLKYNVADETKAQDALGQDSTTSLGDNASRIGIRGKQETGIDGVTAAFRGEWKVLSGDSGDFGAGRLAYVSLNTDYGNINVGRMWTPAFLMVGSMTDILDGNGSAPHHDYANDNGRQDSATSYTTPKMGGFQAALLLQTGNDPVGGDDETIDMYNLAATYEIAGFRLAGSLTSNELTDNDTNLVAVSYTMDALYVAALYSDNDNNATGLEEITEIAGSYSMGNAKLLANYVDYDDGGSHVAAEVQYKLGKKARVFASYINYDSDAERLVTDGGLGQADALSFGYRVDF